MTVYWAPRSNYAGFLNDLGRGAAGIVTNLIGQQVAGMFDRANRAREVEAARAVAGALGDTTGMNEEQMLGGLLTNPQWGKMSPEAQKQWMYLANLRGQNYGGDMYRRGVVGQGGTNAQADTVIGAHFLGLGDSNVGKTIDWTHPKLETLTHDLGDRVLTYRQNPYRQGIVEGSMMNLGKGVSPDTQLTADVQREGYQNALDVARLENSGRIGAARIAAEARGGGGGSPFDIADLVKQREQLTADLSMRDPRTEADVINRLNYSIALIDNAINGALPPLPVPNSGGQQPQVDKERAIADMMDQGATREQAEETFNRRYKTQ